MEWRPEAFQHVVQKADAGVDVALAGPVQVEGDGDLGLAGLAFDGGGAHLGFSRCFRCIAAPAAPGNPRPGKGYVIFDISC